MKKLSPALKLIIAATVSSIVAVCIVSITTFTSTSQKKPNLSSINQYDQFVSFLHTNSDAYEGCSDEFMKKQYEDWKSGVSYVDIKYIDDKFVQEDMGTEWDD